MRNWIYSTAAALAAFCSLSTGSANALPADRLAVPSAVEQTQFIFGGRNYCWYDNGWHGPGFLLVRLCDASWLRLGRRSWMARLESWCGTPRLRAPWPSRNAAGPTWNASRWTSWRRSARGVATEAAIITGNR